MKDGFHNGNSLVLLRISRDIAGNNMYLVHGPSSKAFSFTLLQPVSAILQAVQANSRKSHMRQLAKWSKRHASKTKLDSIDAALYPDHRIYGNMLDIDKKRQHVSFIITKHLTVYAR